MDTDEVGLRFLTTAARLRRAVDEHMAATGASLARTKVLRLLADLGPLNQARLATELGLAARSITQAVETMERDGLVLRSADADDRRAKVVTLTDTGLMALSAGESAGQDLLHRVFGRLSADQLTALDGLLAVIADYEP